jgi:hypothetical protein
MVPEADMWVPLGIEDAFNIDLGTAMHDWKYSSAAVFAEAFQCLRMPMRHTPTRSHSFKFEMRSFAIILE